MGQTQGPKRNTAPTPAENTSTTLTGNPAPTENPASTPVQTLVPTHAGKPIQPDASKPICWSDSQHSLPAGQWSAPTADTPQWNRWVGAATTAVLTHPAKPWPSTTSSTTNPTSYPTLVRQIDQDRRHNGHPKKILEKGAGSTISSPTSKLKLGHPDHPVK